MPKFNKSINDLYGDDKDLDADDAKFSKKKNNLNYLLANNSVGRINPLISMERRFGIAKSQAKPKKPKAKSIAKPKKPKVEKHMSNVELVKKSVKNYRKSVNIFNDAELFKRV